MNIQSFARTLREASAPGKLWTVQVANSQLVMVFLNDKPFLIARVDHLKEPAKRSWEILRKGEKPETKYQLSNLEGLANDIITGKFK